VKVYPDGGSGGRACRPHWLTRLRYVGDAPRNDLVKVYEIDDPGPPSQPYVDDDDGAESESTADKEPNR
jgi:hypothetical protein